MSSPIKLERPLDIPTLSNRLQSGAINIANIAPSKIGIKMGLPK
jgi:hypothetical protein